MVQTKFHIKLLNSPRKNGQGELLSEIASFRMEFLLKGLFDKIYGHWETQSYMIHV